MARRRRRRTTAAGGLGGLLAVILIGGFLLLRSNPTLLANLPPSVRTIVNSINLPTAAPAPGGQQPAGNGQIGVRTKSSGCQAANALPDTGCTPGAVFPGVTTAQICQSGYAGSVRNVPDSEKNDVYAEYGITSHASGQY